MTNVSAAEQERLPFIEGWRTPTTRIDGRLVAQDTLQLALLTPEKRCQYGDRFEGNNGTLPKDYHGPKTATCPLGYGGGSLGGGYGHGGFGGHHTDDGLHWEKVSRRLRRGNTDE